jgi:hypothetical protein
MEPFEPRRLTASDPAAAAAVIRIAFAEQGAVTDPPSSALGETAEIVADELGSGGGAGLEYEGGLRRRALDAARRCALPRAAGGFAGVARARPRRTMIDAAEAEARRRGLELLRLHARLELPMNRRLFARRGFVEVGFRAHPGYIRPTFAVMEKAMV